MHGVIKSSRFKRYFLTSAIYRSNCHNMVCLSIFRIFSVWLKFRKYFIAVASIKLRVNYDVYWDRKMIKTTSSLSYRLFKIVLNTSIPICMLGKDNSAEFGTHGMNQEINALTIYEDNLISYNKWGKIIFKEHEKSKSRKLTRGIRLWKTSRQTGRK